MPVLLGFLGAWEGAKTFGERMTALTAPQRIQISSTGPERRHNRDENVMIQHLSIAARDPQHVAEVLAEFMGGAATRFTPNPGSWFAHQHDEYGTGVEVYPAGTELRPAGPEGAGFAMTEPIRSRYSPTHFALSVPISQEQIAEIAEREGWQCYCCERGTGGFHVMEVWIENTGMVELLPPAFAAEYLMLTRRVHAA